MCVLILNFFFERINILQHHELTRSRNLLLNIDFVIDLYCSSDVCCECEHYTDIYKHED